MRHLIITFSIFSILTALPSCDTGECAGCGGCDYEPFVETAEIVKFEEEGDSVKLVEFKLENGGYFTLYPRDFESDVESNFEIKDMRETREGYVVSGEVIKKGSCKPFWIQKIELNGN